MINSVLFSPQCVVSWFTNVAMSSSPSPVQVLIKGRRQTWVKKKKYSLCKEHVRSPRCFLWNFSFTNTGLIIVSESVMVVSTCVRFKGDNKEFCSYPLVETVGITLGHNTSETSTPNLFYIGWFFSIHRVMYYFEPVLYSPLVCLI